MSGPDSTNTSDSSSDSDLNETAADEHEWRFAVDDVGPDVITEQTATPDNEPIERGSIELEHAIFVVLGVVITLSVLLLGF